MKSPVAYTVSFDLPYVLMVADGFRDEPLEKWVKAGGKSDSGDQAKSRYIPLSPVRRILGGACPVYVPSKMEIPYTVSVQGIEISLSFLKRVNPHRQTVQVGEIIDDRYGRSAFSSVRVHFDLANIPDSAIHPDFRNDTGVYCSLALDAVNHFVSHYRIFAKRAYARPLTHAAIQEFFCTITFDDGSEFTQERGFGGGIFTSLNAVFPDADNDDSTFREIVKNGAVPDIETTLLANIYDFFALSEWRLALIESAIYFESWLCRCLREKYLAKGLTPLDVEIKFKRDDGQPKGITSIAKTLVKDATGFHFAKTAEFDDWQNYARDMRNKVVHGQKQVVTRDEGIAAFRAVEKAKALLETKGLS